MVWSYLLTFLILFTLLIEVILIPSLIFFPGMSLNLLFVNLRSIYISSFFQCPNFTGNNYSVDDQRAVDTKHPRRRSPKFFIDRIMTSPSNSFTSVCTKTWKISMHFHKETILVNKHQ